MDNKKEIQKTLEILTKNNIITAKQIDFILQPTPKSQIYKRAGKGGQIFDYVKGSYVKKVLNYVFNWLWDFEVKNFVVNLEAKQVIVHGRLTIKNIDLQPIITKEQFGRADIKYLRNNNSFLDLGNDLKAAATDALKKCASELGVAYDVYNKEEKAEIKAETIYYNKYNKKQNINNSQPITATKLQQLKNYLKGKTDDEKIKYLNERYEIMIKDFNITEAHANVILTQLLAADTKK